MLISFLKVITVDRRESFGKLVRLNRAAKVLRIILAVGNGAASIVSRRSYAVLVRYRCIKQRGEIICAVGALIQTADVDGIPPPILVILVGVTAIGGAIVTIADITHPKANVKIKAAPKNIPGRSLLEILQGTRNFIKEKM